MHQRLTLAERLIVAEVPQRLTARHAVAGDVTLDRGKFERERRNRPRQAGERLGLKALHVDLDEGREPVKRDQRVERRHPHGNALIPVLPLPAGRTFRCLHKIRRGSRDRRIVDIDFQIDLTGGAADRDRYDFDGPVAPVDEPQERDQRGLRLARDDARTEPPERRDAVPHMGAHVEHEIAGLDEARVKPSHRCAIALAAVIDAERPDDTPKSAKALAHHAERSAAASIARSPSFRSGAGGAVSSGSAPMPARISARPTLGHELMTASGIESAGPPAMNSAYGMAAGTVNERMRIQLQPSSVCGQSWCAASPHSTE